MTELSLLKEDLVKQFLAAINIEQLNSGEIVVENNFGLMQDILDKTPNLQLVTLRPTQQATKPQTLEASVPAEQIIQSVPIETLLTTDSTTPPSSQIFTKKTGGVTVNVNMAPVNTSSILGIPTQQLQMMETKAQASEQELVAFIQNLMLQANKEQEDRPTFSPASSLRLPGQGSPFFPIQAMSPVETVKPLPAPQLYSADLITSTVRGLVEKLTTSIVPSTTSTTTTSSSPPSTPPPFVPIALQSFPKISLTDFVSPASLGEKNQQTIEVTEPSQKFTTEASPLLPFRTTARARTTPATTTTTSTTTTPPPPQDLLQKLLSEAAAPLAGLSAATLAYSAAAMLPVWLPAALGRKRRLAGDEQAQEQELRRLWRAFQGLRHEEA